MTTPAARPPRGGAPAQPSVVPGMTLLAVAAVLIVVVLVNPTMPQWLRIVIAVLAVLVVVALLVWSMRLFRVASRRSRGPS